MHTEHKLKKNIGIDYFYSFLFNFDVTAAIWVLYLIARGMNLVQVGLLEEIYHAASFCIEVPSGAVADLPGHLSGTTYHQENRHQNKVSCICYYGRSPDSIWNGESGSSCAMFLWNRSAWCHGVSSGLKRTEYTTGIRTARHHYIHSKHDDSLLMIVIFPICGGIGENMGLGRSFVIVGVLQLIIMVVIWLFHRKSL